jgi:hypothetical protein
MAANFSDLSSFVKAFISARLCSEVNISLICQSVYIAPCPFAGNHWMRDGVQALPKASEVPISKSAKTKGDNGIGPIRRLSLQRGPVEKTNAGALCGTGKLTPDVEAQGCRKPNHRIGCFFRGYGASSRQEISMPCEAKAGFLKIWNAIFYRGFYLDELGEYKGPPTFRRRS